MEETFARSLARFAAELTESFGVGVPAQPEDQLKGPVMSVLKCAGARHRVVTRTETQLDEIAGRPDIGVVVDGLLCGFVELKAPGKGANPKRSKGSDQDQWGRFRQLPNLVYTDGNEWALFRTGERVDETVHFSGDVTTDGPRAFTSDQAEALRRLLVDFLLWEPIVPSHPRGLAQLLAPLCRLVRVDVATALRNPDSNLSQLASEWRKVLFPDADDAQFADAYAQTLTYALLLARLEGQRDVKPALAAETLDTGHGLLAQAVRILGQPEARSEIGVGLGLLVRVINAIRPEALARKGADPWLYFYEDFLAEYDSKLRKDRGVYYTPVQVVQAQVRLVADLLRRKFRKELGFASPGVVVLDPAAGTGAYPLAAMQHGMEAASERFGQGSVSGYASEMARTIHAFEILVGPYAVAHLRLTQRVLDGGGSLPDDGVHVYLTDTLESPHAQPPAGQMTLMYRRLGEEHKRAQEVKSHTRVLVCIGNPPYDRQEIGPGEEGVERRGGWVRFGDGTEPGILEDFLRPARDAGSGVHLKNLYNDYVYFWRWALWKVFDSTQGPGIVCFITAASYLRGPGFAGMRQVMRQTFDELWLLDLEGGGLGARKTENVFAIRTPVAIALGVRYGRPKPDRPAKVHYARIEGGSEEKLARLGAVQRIRDLDWQECFQGWGGPLLPENAGDFFEWPTLTDLFPWQYSGVQMKRTWPIAEAKDVLQRRWRALVSTPADERGALFREAGRRVAESYLPSAGAKTRLRALSKEPATAPVPAIVRYGFRSFDRQWLIKDVRLGDRMRPPLWLAHGSKQIHMTSLLTDVLGQGPAATVTAEVPDLHHFSGRGAKDVIPLWRDAVGKEPNVTRGLLEKLAAEYDQDVSAEDLFAYCYSVLACPDYVDRYSEELTIPGPHIPITRDPDVFRETAEMGKTLLWVHTYGERFSGGRRKKGQVPHGEARSVRAIPSDRASYPERFGYDEPTRTLHVGRGSFAPVLPEVWSFSVSGLEVVKSWLSYRMKKGAGRKSSELDAIRPEQWTADMTVELLQLLWVLEATAAMFPRLRKQLGAIVEGPVFLASELPQPSPEERLPPGRDEETVTQKRLEV